MKVLTSLLVCLAVVLCLPSIGRAQVNAHSGNKIGWTQPAPTLEVAQGYAYTYRDSGVMGASLTGVVCTAGTNATEFSCRANLPALTPGPHSLTLVAIDTSTLTPLESAESVALTFQFRERPATPRALAILP